MCWRSRGAPLNCWPTSSRLDDVSVRRGYSGQCIALGVRQAAAIGEERHARALNVRTVGPWAYLAEFLPHQLDRHDLMARALQRRWLRSDAGDISAYP